MCIHTGIDKMCLGFLCLTLAMLLFIQSTKQVCVCVLYVCMCEHVCACLLKILNDIDSLKVKPNKIE